MTVLRLIVSEDPAAGLAPEVAELVPVRPGEPPPEDAGWRAVIEAPDAAVALAELADAVDRGASAASVPEPTAADDFLAVRDALDGRRAVPPELVLADELRREPPPV